MQTIKCSIEESFKQKTTTRFLIKRLAKGIEADTTGKYEKLKGLPKGLLPIGKGFKVPPPRKNDFMQTIRTRNRPDCWIWNAEGELYIRDKPLIGHWVVDLLKSDFVQTICIISNAHFYNQFEQWYNQVEDKSRIVLLNDGSTSNETRLGAGKDSNMQHFHRFAARK